MKAELATNARYKSYRRYMKKGGPGQMMFGPEWRFYRMDHDCLNILSLLYIYIYMIIVVTSASVSTTRWCLFCCLLSVESLKNVDDLNRIKWTFNVALELFSFEVLVIDSPLYPIGNLRMIYVPCVFMCVCELWFSSFCSGLSSQKSKFYLCTWTRIRELFLLAGNHYSCKKIIISTWNWSNL